MEPGPEPSLAAEQFECGVCCKQLVGPKLLPCLHSACRECLRNEWAGQSSAPCPVCCAPTDGDVANLQDNMMVDNLVSQLELSRRIGLGSDIWCSVCQACGDKQPATSLCFQCDHFLCPRCCHSHQVLMERYGHLARTLDHLRMLRCEDFVTLARDEKQTICPDHKEQYIRFFCKTCSTSSCCNCLLLHHISADHRYHDIKQEAVLKKEELKQMVDATQENHNTFTEIYTGLKSLMGNLDCVRNDTETLIKQKASAMIEVINKQGDALLRELETEHNTEHSRLTQSLDQTQQIIKRMGAGKELAGIMLKFGTSEEMMEMYNTIQSALTALVGETPNDVSNGATLIKFLQCTLEAHNLLGTFILKKEQSEGAEDSEVEEALLATLAHNGREQQWIGGGEPDLQDLTEVEQQVSALMGILVGTVASGEATTRMGSDDDQPEAQQPAPEPSTSGDGGDDEEGDDNVLTERETPSVPPSANTTSGEKADFEGFDDSEAPGPRGLQQLPAGREARNPAPRRLSRPRSPAERRADEDLDLMSLSGETTQMQQDFRGALERVVQSIDALAVSVGEAASSIARASQGSNEPLLARSQREMGLTSDSGVSAGMTRAMVDVAAAIASQAQATQELRDVMLSVIAGMNSQTAAFQAQCTLSQSQSDAVQSLTAAILSELPTVRRGNDGAGAGQQDVLTHGSPDADAPPHMNGSGPLEMESAVLPQDDSIPAPTTAPPPLHRPQSTPEPSQPAAAHAEAVESRPRAGSGCPGRPSASHSQQLSSSLAVGTEATLRRSSRRGRGGKCRAKSDWRH
uniref:uncharacterized protein isoform X4 n=1 Tax=Pristiophorus japonicus TaxID=55135 RepID=UPI00398E5AA9